MQGPTVAPVPVGLVRRAGATIKLDRPHRAVRRAGSGARGRRRVVVDALEIGEQGGMLMMRGGALDEPPLCIAFPAAVAADVVKGLGEARLDGEEEYGDTVVPRVRAMGTQDPGLITAQLSAWLLAQDWDAVIDAVPDGPQGVFLVTYTGHVGLCAGEPFTDGPALTILAPSCTGCSPTSSRRCCRRRTGPGRSARRPAAGRRRAVQTAMSKSSWAPTESPQSGRPGLQAPVRDR